MYLRSDVTFTCSGILKADKTKKNFRHLIRFLQEHRSDDLLQSDDEAEYVDAEEVDVGMVESILEQNVDDPQLQQEARIIRLNIYDYKDYETLEN